MPVTVAQWYKKGPHHPQPSGLRVMPGLRVMSRLDSICHTVLSMSFLQSEALLFRWKMHSFLESLFGLRGENSWPHIEHPHIHINSKSSLSHKFK